MATLAQISTGHNLNLNFVFVRHSQTRFLYIFILFWFFGPFIIYIYMCIEKAKPETKPKKRIPPEPMTSKKHVLININDFCAAQKPVRLPFVK